LALLAGSLALHLALMPARGYERDMTWLATWMDGAAAEGAPHVYGKLACNYPPGFIYVLEAEGLLWRAATHAELPPDGSAARRFLIKAVPALADLAIAWVLYRLAAARIGPRGALLVLAAVAYNPALLFLSGVWGQFDSIAALLVLLAGAAVAARRPAAGLALAAAAVLVKFQAVVLAPVLLVEVLRRDGARGVVAAASGAAAVALLLLLPFFWAGRAADLVAAVSGLVGYFPFISLHAPNVWWLVGGADAPTISDALRVGNGVLTYRSLGTVALAGATALILARLWRDPREDRAAAVLEACALEMIAFSLFPTEMHERYVVPALAPLAAACLARPRAWWLYGALSGVALLAMGGSLEATYPGHAGPLARLLPASGAGMSIAAAGLLSIFLALFATRDRPFMLGAAAAAGALAAAVATIAWWPLARPARLCEWEPVAARQDWGTPRHDRSVEGRRLEVFGFIFRHGIGTHASSRLTYHLNGAFRTFDTCFGLDSETNRGQRIEFRVLVDGAVRFSSGPFAGYEWPRHVRLPVAGAQFLTLEVLDGGDGNTGDHGDWLEPVLER
jgi:hypothetical protein